MSLIASDPVAEERAALESPVRRAFLRAVLVAVAFAVVFAAVKVIHLLLEGTPIGRFWIEPLVIGLTVGCVAGPTALVELWARRLAPSLRRDVTAALAVALVALPCIAFAALQASYTTVLIESGTPWTAWRAVRAFGRAMTRERLEFIRLFGSGAVLFGALALVRLRGHSLERQALLLVLGAGCVSVPLLIVVPPTGMDVGIPVVWIASTAFVVAFVGAAADALEERVLSWASGIPRERPPRAPLRQRLRGRWWVLLLALVLAGAFAATGFVSERARQGLPLLGSAHPGFDALANHTLAPAEAARVTSQLTTVDLSMRRHVGTKDYVAVVARREKIPDGLQLLVGANVSVDRGFVRSSWVWFVPWTREAESFPVALGGTLAPGTHEVALVVSGTISGGPLAVEGPSTEHRWTVTVGPEASVVKQDGSVSLAGSTVELEDDGRGLRFRVAGLPLPLSGFLEVRDETGLLLASQAVFARAHESMIFWVDSPALHGRRQLTGRVIPDAGPMLAADTELDTILGVPVEAKCIFERE